MIKSPTGIKEKLFAFEDFQGLDDSRDIAAMDTGQKQALTRVENGYCDWRGNVVKDAGAEQFAEPNYLIKNLNFYGIGLPVWAQQDGGGIALRALPSATKTDAFLKNSVISSTTFNSNVMFFSKDQTMQKFNGVAFSDALPAVSKLKPAFGVPCQTRLCVAGDINRTGIVDISRVNSDNIFYQDETLPIIEVTAAGALDIRNLISTNDVVKGLGVVEQNKLVIFTNDQAIIYQLNPDFTKWVQDDKGSVSVGTFSHNTIANAGVDLIFANRYGIYSMRRSDNNGVTMFTIPLSSRIDLLYRRLIRSVENVEDINAFYDADNGQYHLFFPQGLLTTRLTMSVSPVAGAEPKWSTSTYLAQTCGKSLGGFIMLGSAGGVWVRGNIEDEFIIHPDLIVETPILWNGSLVDTKESTRFLLQATGKGTVLVEAMNEEGKALQSWTQQVGEGDDNLIDIPLSKQYERKFEHRYRGVRFRFTVKGKGLMKIIGFAVMVRT